METTWTLDVLPDEGEDVVAVDRGTEPNPGRAYDAVLDALLLAVTKSGRPERQEYRLCLGGCAMTVWPGREDDGRVDLAGLDEDLRWLASAAERR